MNLIASKNMTSSNLQILIMMFAAVSSSLTDLRAAPAAPGDTRIGQRIPDFVLPDTTGRQVALSDFNEARFLIVVFLGTECPIGNAYVPVLNELQSQFKDKSVQVLGVNSNLSDTSEAIRAHVRDFQVRFPVLIDHRQVIADLFNARRTPEAFLLDRRRHIRYCGRIDDRFGLTYKRETPRRRDLIEAVTEQLAGQTPSVAETEPAGCLITRRDRLENRDTITFAEHVSRILQTRCANCHHPGTAAPFSLLNYEQARDRAEMIRETVTQRRMPPWSADPRHGQFSNDLRLSETEIDTLVAWVDNGSPPGDPDDLPATVKYADGWTIGSPDLTFRMPRTYTVPATGTVKYQYFVTPTHFKEDVWVQASEARPGNWSAVHHIIVFVREKNSRRFRGLPSVGGYAPGEEAMVLPPDVGFRIPAGAELVWQVHYTPTGKVETDRCEIGLILCRNRPQRRIRQGGAFNFRFRIPPGAEQHRVTSSAEFSRDMELLSLMPHMHLRGKDFRYTARFPDGTTRILLNIPSYDFNWQHRYRLKQPVLLPAGTTLECVAHFDNSIHNPANPDPAQTVRWGDQTWEEMMIGWYTCVEADETRDSGK